ncbi:MAG TPA: glycosyltransferase [Kineosporiaceae bacterium]
MTSARSAAGGGSRRRLRIAMISEHASPLAMLGGHDAGGQNVHVAALATALADRGHQVEIYTRRDDPRIPTVVPLHPGVDVVHVPAGPAEPLPKDELPEFMLWFGAWLASRWRRGEPDVVHAHFWMSGTAALHARAMLAALTGNPAAGPGRVGRPPVVQTFHALGSVKRRHQRERDTSPPQRITVETRLAQETDAVVATCGDEVRELAASGVGTTMVDVVPCGVDLARFTPRGTCGPASGGTPEAGRHRLLCLGRLVERKGVDTVIAALTGLPDTELLVAGGPPAEGIAADEDCRRLLATAARHGVADQVRLLGQVSREEAPALIRSADLVVSVPWYEPFGIVPVEAMACGVPVVTSAVGGMLETVVDGVTGLHVPPSDPAALAAALRTLLDDPSRRAAMGAAGARRAASEYGWARVAAATEGVYRRLVAGAHPGTAPVRRARPRRAATLTPTRAKAAG